MTSVFGSEPSSLNEYEWCSVPSCAATVLDLFLADDQSRARYRAALMTRVNQITLYSVPSNALQMKSMGYHILDNQITNSIRVWFGLSINLTKKSLQIRLSWSWPRQGAWQIQKTNTQVKYWNIVQYHNWFNTHELLVPAARRGETC